MTDCRTCEHYSCITLKDKPHTITVKCKKGCSPYMMMAEECPYYELWSEYYD